MQEGIRQSMWTLQEGTGSQVQPWQIVGGPPSPLLPEARFPPWACLLKSGQEGELQGGRALPVQPAGPEPPGEEGVPGSHLASAPPQRSLTYALF